MIIDTDVLIWYLKGNVKARKLLGSLDGFEISVITYMELVQGMRNKQELNTLRKTLNRWQVKTLFISEEISAKAMFFVEQHFLSHSVQLADALIAASASSAGLTLCTANVKHYKALKGIELKKFRP